ncbi:hypothetical protein BDV33DRAFT_138458 [Aspergillus novoparasiticus]|uniref:Uncharacterized protein n=1 Tax=Aspergillus novoparasiticus TaxID=986946 RepID=A0A5N6EIJ0_9EURO|nr:hypothetical protein BDV33DRAFT_138458 [Aspergillus novoparasiticus]
MYLVARALLLFNGSQKAIIMGRLGSSSNSAGCAENQSVRFALLRSTPFVAFWYANQRALVTAIHTGGVVMELPLRMPWGALRYAFDADYKTKRLVRSLG